MNQSILSFLLSTHINLELSIKDQNDAVIKAESKYKTLSDEGDGLDHLIQHSPRVYKVDPIKMQVMLIITN